MSIAPDIIADVELFPSAAGGRRGPTPPGSFSCPLKIAGSYYDCRILLGPGPLAPGERRTVPIKFLDFDAVKDKIRPGDGFELWEGGTIGRGVVVSIVAPDEP